MTKPVRGSDGRGVYTRSVTSSDSVTSTLTGNSDTGSSASTQANTGRQTASMAGGTGTSTYAGTTTLHTASAGTGWVDGATRANGLYQSNGTGGETLTARETHSLGAASGTFTEILSGTGSQSGLGSATGHSTLSATGTRGHG